MSILVTNDDSVDSPGIYGLISAASRLDDVITVAPDSPKSGVSKSMTFHKMLRANERMIEIDGKERKLISISGTPADCVLFALGQFPQKNISLVVAGVNPGDNTSYHSIFTSGTLGACIEAALMGLPAISFSHQSRPENWFNHNGFQLENEVIDLMEMIIRKALENGFPPKTNIISVNIPISYTMETQIKVRPPQTLRFENNVIWEKDPLGNDYFWLGGKEHSEKVRGKDCWELLEKGNVVITPLDIGLYAGSDVEAIRKWFE